VALLGSGRTYGTLSITADVGVCVVVGSGVGVSVPVAVRVGVRVLVGVRVEVAVHLGTAGARTLYVRTSAIADRPSTGGMNPTITQAAFASADAGAHDSSVSSASVCRVHCFTGSFPSTCVQTSYRNAE
jgi:hypothetical protein